MGSASAAAVVAVLCRVDDYFASQLRHVLDKNEPSLNLVNCRNFRKKRNIICVVSIRSTLNSINSTACTSEGAFSVGAWAQPVVSWETGYHYYVPKFNQCLYINIRSDRSLYIGTEWYLVPGIRDTTSGVKISSGSPKRHVLLEMDIDGKYGKCTWMVTVAMRDTRWQRCPTSDVRPICVQFVDGVLCRFYCYQRSIRARVVPLREETHDCIVQLATRQPELAR